MTRRTLAALLVAAAACTSATDAGNGVVALEVIAPQPAALELGDTVQFRARALNRDGDSIAATIVWRTADTLFIRLDSLTGTITGRDTANVTARVQAFVGNLRSTLDTLRIEPRADTLIVGPPDTLTVATTDQASAALVATVRSFAPDLAVAQRTLIYTIVTPAIPDPALRPVELSNGAVADTVVTGLDGTPVTPVLVRRVAGQAAPAVVEVEVTGTRRRGTPIPGSGQRFTILFQ